MDKKGLKQLIWNLIFFVILSAVVFWFVLKDQDPREIIEIAKGVNLNFVLAGVGLMLVFFGFEAWNIRSLLRSFGEKKVGFLKAYKFTLIGFFFAAVTPGATGGQPAEVYYMTKDGVSAGNGALALLIQVCGIQIATVLLGLIGVIANFGALSGGLWTLTVIGVILNSIALAVMMVAIFSPGLAKKIVNFVVKIFTKLGIKAVKDKQASINKSLSEYAKGSAYIKKHPKEFWLCMLRAVLQYAVYFSIPFLVYKAFGLSGYGFFQIFAMQALIFMATSALPLPGAIGASEASFFDLFKPVFGAEILRSATLLNRGITFYGCVFFTMLVVCINNLLLHRGPGNRK